MNLSELHFRANSHDDKIVFKELVVDDMYKFNDIFEITKLYDNWVCIDGGGHIGLFSLMLNEYINADKIMTYEPNPDSFKYCKINTQNHPKIHVIQKGLDIKNGYFNLFPPKDIADTGSWSMVPTNMHDYNNGIQIETIDLAQYLISLSNADYNILLKLDIEGYEAHIINNISDDALKKVKILILEEHHIAIEHEKLDRLGFRLLFHPANSQRHFVYFNVDNESPLVKTLFDIKCHIGDHFWREKVSFLKRRSKITLRRLISGLINKLSHPFQ